MPSTMTLTVSTGAEIPNPTDAEIRDALGALDVNRDGEGFAILAAANMTYVQVGGDAQQGFDMEYQEGSVDRHYRANREDYSLDEVVAIFGAYRDGGVDWPKVGQWSKITW